jgi:hypothetical protein
MSETTPGAVQRQLQQAQAAMKKARQAIAGLRGAEPPPQAVERALKLGWESLAAAHRLLASIPLDAATEEVMTRQIAAQRYATALLVRLRRLRRKDFRPAAGDDDLDEDDS